MIEVTSFRGRSVGVFGLARSGLSAIESLIAGGARVFAWDDRDAGREAATEKGARLENWALMAVERNRRADFEPGRSSHPS